MKIIIDFDGTLTVEENQARPLSEISLDTLSNEILGVSRDQLAADYAATRNRLLAAPHAYKWEVNGLAASYCDEGAFILNTTTMQVMLKGNEGYLQTLADVYPNSEYSPVITCVNYLFHRHTAEFSPEFRPAARDVLSHLCDHNDYDPIILTNSLADKVIRHLGVIDFAEKIAVLGDTRQYEMAPDWQQHFSHPELGEIQVWPVSPRHSVDLRRPDYYRALKQEAADGSRLVVVADTFSMPGAMPLMLDIPFLLLRTPYTPDWCFNAVSTHPHGHILEDLADLPQMVARLHSRERA